MATLFQKDVLFATNFNSGVSMHEMLIADWDQLVKVAGNMDKGNAFTNSYCFRGQESAEWKLESSLHRSITRDGKAPLPSALILLGIESLIKDKFLAVALHHLPQVSVSSSNADADWWPLMRHYGVPTRILDWTHSIYVAAYFAVAGSPEKDGAIYAIHTSTLDKAMNVVYGDKECALPGATHQFDEKFNRADSPPVVFVMTRRRGLVDRMIVQQGIFMVSQNVSANLEDVLSTEMPKVTEGESATHVKLIIPVSAKPGIMRRLRSVNITASSLFPGLDGIGRHLDELTRSLQV